MTTETVQRFTMRHLPGQLFERHAAAFPPDDGIIAFVDDGTRERTGRHWLPALRKDGGWLGMNKRPLKIEPTFWTVILDAKDAG